MGAWNRFQTRNVTRTKQTLAWGKVHFTRSGTWGGREAESPGARGGASPRPRAECRARCQCLAAEPTAGRLGPRRPLAASRFRCGAGASGARLRAGREAGSRCPRTAVGHRRADFWRQASLASLASLCPQHDRPEWRVRRPPRCPGGQARLPSGGWALGTRANSWAPRCARLQPERSGASCPQLRQVEPYRQVARLRGPRPRSSREACPVPAAPRRVLTTWTLHSRCARAGEHGSIRGGARVLFIGSSAGGASRAHGFSGREMTAAAGGAGGRAAALQGGRGVCVELGPLPRAGTRPAHTPASSTARSPGSSGLGLQERACARGAHGWLGMDAVAGPGTPGTVRHADLPRQGLPGLADGRCPLSDILCAGWGGRVCALRPGRPPSRPSLRPQDTEGPSPTAQCGAYDRT